MDFNEAVNNADGISACIQPGKSALGANRQKVQEEDSRKLNGSVDLDKCLQTAEPDGNRWDYIIGYENVAYFAEVHPAHTSEVSVVLKKLAWLKDWLASNGKDLDQIKATEAFHWLFTKRNAIARGSSYERKLVQAGIGMPKRALVLK